MVAVLRIFSALSFCRIVGATDHTLLISALIGGVAYLLLIIAVAVVGVVCWCKGKNTTGCHCLVHHSQGSSRANGDYKNQGTPEHSTEVEVDKLHDKIRELLEEAGGVHGEFNRLSVGANRPQLRSRRKGNRAKNRYKNIYPYDFNQVQLTKLHSDPLSTYINANYINGYFKPQAYIATQGPKRTTVGDFWRMVFEKEITRVVMLTNHVEKDVVKCDSYWLDGYKLDVGRFLISVTKKLQRSHWTFRKINATSKETGESLVVNHFHFTVWSDDSTADELAQAEFVFRVRRTPNPNNSPLLVHCSAGIGRTGTYIAVDYLLDQVFTDHKVDVFGVVNTMRQQRNSMVQNVSQYLSVYTTLYEALLVGDTTLPVAVFKQGAGHGTFTMGNITVPHLIKKLGRERGNAESEGSYKNIVRVNGGADVLTVMMPSRLSLKGYLVTEAPSVTTASSFWELTTSHDSSTVIVLPKSQQMLPCFLPTLGSSLDWTPLSVKCSMIYDISPDIVLRNVERKMEGHVSSPPVRVYLLKTINPNVVLDLVAEMESRSGATRAEPVTIMFGEGERRMATLFCILNNILQGVKNDNEVEIYNNIRRLGHLFDNDLTEVEVSTCFELASSFIETQKL
ncbi:receptor-type tyrosine-protein phosphatase epsilon-like [Haliotis rufescens]|uniref:receptor-type tyrosine-protein phosphatase epsilon-like n=1 Tax=Haliotis rufescens TaxID=6454 RepID=UPI00201EE832|nr:receptor-type tyrosine-protein phosphatase epsilon-like [Haliotis rufescens]